MNTQLKAQDQVRWVSTEDNVEFEHFGIVLEADSNKVLFETAHGAMEVQQGDGEFHVHVGVIPAVFREVEIDNSTKEDKVKSVKSGSNQDLCNQLIIKMLSEDGNVNSATMKQAIMDEFGMSKAGASTYFYNSKRFIRDHNVTL